jgi:hypothetical protein
MTKQTASSSKQAIWMRQRYAHDPWARPVISTLPLSVSLSHSEENRTEEGTFLMARKRSGSPAASLRDQLVFLFFLFLFLCVLSQVGGYACPSGQES